MHRPGPALPAPGIRDRLAARLSALSRPDTARGTLRHQLTAHGMTVADLAAGAILPETLIQGWLDGTTAITPGWLVRCASTLQMPEDTLLACLGGSRARHYWPLPQPDIDQVTG
ncbi:helix-turn-helix domain-containing protein [Streptomyces tsukubensis]|uniref:helix-turn-helix domain-containing protein n=1 Tax=Streptomyces tsukubensis TaxID=83656 RepID=UPI003450BD41